MADQKVSALTQVTYPLGATDWMYAAQGGNPRKVNPRRVGGDHILDIQSASSSAHLDFVSGFDGSCDVYELVLQGIRPASGSVDLQLLFSKDGGSSFESTNYSWLRAAVQFESVVASGNASSGNLTDSNILLFPTLGNDSGQSFSGSFRFYDLNNAALVKGMTGNSMSHYNTGGGLVHYGTFHSGLWNNTSDAVNGIRVKFSSGNIDSGKGWLRGLPA